MEQAVSLKSHRMLFFNTLAFVSCFAAWMLNGVLVTFLVDNGIFNWGPVETGWLLGIPVLTGSVFRLPMGMLADKYGGKWVFGLLIIFCAIPLYFLSYANSFWSFAGLSFLFGMSGTGFAVGVAYTSVWYPKKNQGTALGIFGAGNAGASITTLLGPTLLQNFTNHGENPEGWRYLPQLYAGVMLVMGVIFLLFTVNKKPTVKRKTLSEQLKPLKEIRVWRFGLYYFLVFGCFVAFAQWLVPYFVNVYDVSLVQAGFFASLFSMPSGLIRAFGGWLSDKIGGRRVMYWVLGSSLVISVMLVIPKMQIISPGKGIMAAKAGTVTYVSDSLVKVGEKSYILQLPKSEFNNLDERMMVFPKSSSWHSPVVKAGDVVKKKQLLAKGTTQIYFQANVWIFAILVTIIGIMWGIGKAAVYKHIPEYYPDEVGVVGGMVGVLGGLGGFFCPIFFGYLLEWTGLWTSSWFLMMLISAICIFWMHRVITRMMHREAPVVMKQIG